MLSFEEFLAGTNREQNKKEQAEKQTINEKVNKKKAAKFSDNDDIIETKTNKTKDDKKDSKKDVSDDIFQSKNDAKKIQTSSSFFNSIGEFLEMHQMQAFIIVMITLDSFASFGEICLNYHLLQNPYYSIPNINIDGSDISSIQSILSNIDMTVYIAIFKSITTFTIFFSAIEISLVLAIFGLNVIGHYGYLIDAIIVASQLYLEIKGFGRETRILNLFRFWRFVRLFVSMVNAEKELHLDTKLELEEKIIIITKFDSETRRLENELSKEKDARDSIEAMLQNYKDEVDTLNEALKIAAMDIAEVAQADDDYFLSDEDDEDIDDVDADESTIVSSIKSLSTKGEKDLYMDAASTEFDRNKNKGVLYKEARAAQTLRAEKESGVSVIQSNVFHVHHDGTFEKK